MNDVARARPTAFAESTAVQLPDALKKLGAARDGTRVGQVRVEREVDVGGTGNAMAYQR